MNRRRLLSAAPAFGLAGMFAASAVPAVPGRSDPLVALVNQWKKAFRSWEDETARPGGGDCDTPECLRLEAIRESLNDQIEATAPTTPAGIIALLEFAWICDGADCNGDYVSIKKGVVRNIIKARALIAA